MSEIITPPTEIDLTQAPSLHSAKDVFRVDTAKQAMEGQFERNKEVLEDLLSQTQKILLDYRTATMTALQTQNDNINAVLEAYRIELNQLGDLYNGLLDRVNQQEASIKMLLGFLTELAGKE